MKKDSENKSIKKNILAVALSPTVSQFFFQYVDEDTTYYISKEEQLEEFFDEHEEFDLDFIVCGCDLGVNFPLEVGQLFSSECPDTPLIFLGDKAKSMRIEDLYKNGFSEIFLYPMDQEVFLRKLSGLLGRSLKESLMLPIRIFDFKSQDPINFDLYLFFPLNMKYIRFLRNGSVLTKQTLDKLLKYEFTTLYIKSENYEELCNLGIKKLRNQIDQFFTNRKEDHLTNLKESIRDLTLNLFDHQDDEEIKPILSLDRCIEIFNRRFRKENLISDFQKTIGAGHDHYDQIKVRSVLSTLLCMALGMDSPEDVFVAAMLQDVSLWNMDPTLTLEQMLEKYPEDTQSHPERSLKLVKGRLMGIQSKTQYIILQHHEKFDGSGFPHGLKGDEILPESQILNFVNQLEEKMRPILGKQKYSLHAALSSIIGNGTLSPSLEQSIEELFAAHPAN